VVNVVATTMSMVQRTTLSDEEKKELATHILERIAQSDHNSLDATINWGDQVQLQYDLGKEMFSIKFKKPSFCPCLAGCTCTKDRNGTRVTMDGAPPTTQVMATPDMTAPGMSAPGVPEVAGVSTSTEVTVRVESQ
jgi:hypothetical protein